MAESRYPGPLAKAALAELAQYVLTDPYPFVIDLPRCHGMFLATTDGRELFDWAGHYASKLIAHNHPALFEPEYTKRLLYAANNKLPNPDMLTPECLAYYRELYALAPASMKQAPGARLEVYSINSGAEAVENLMKYFINLHHEKLLAKGRLPGVRRFIYFEQAFHGRTVFALNVTQIEHDPMITKDFHGFVPGNMQLPFPAIDADAPPGELEADVEKCLELVEDCLRRYRGEVVGMVVEPIQGAGGHRVAPATFFQGLSRLAHAHDVYLGFDEVQTVGGPCGSFFAFEQFDLPHPPQAVACGKKLGNGVIYMKNPMTDRGVLDSTWGGTLADMVRFVQEMRVVREEKLLEAVPAKTAALVAMLRALQAKHPAKLCNVRGLGLYQGFSLREPGQKGELIDIALEEHDLLFLGAGPDSVRLRPHLSVTEADIAELGRRLDAALARVGQA
jgi:L-lysine 6-transaminase